MTNLGIFALADNKKPRWKVRLVVMGFRRNSRSGHLEAIYEPLP